MTLPSVEWEQCFLEPRRNAELEAEVRKTLGLVPPFIRLFSPCPWLVRSLVRGTFRNGQLVHTDVALADLIFLAVSQDNSCRYCYASQRALLRILGFEEERIQRLEEASFSAEGDPRDRLALDFARRISRANPPPGQTDRVALREAGYSDEGVKELAYIATDTVMANRLSTLPALPVETAEHDRSFLVKLLRPLLARRFRSIRGQPERLPPELRTGPFAYLTLELDGLPIARVLREVLDEAWESPVLSQRAKALIFAVVARGLGSQRSEREARSLLAPLGLDDVRLDEILANLASPELDPIEGTLVPFARETIRYRPADIQRRAGKLHRELGAERFLEVVGIAGLANRVSRLSLALCEG